MTEYFDRFYPGKALENCYLGSFNSECYNGIKDWLNSNNSPQILYLEGKSGSGKTILIESIFQNSKELMSNTKIFYADSFFELMVDWREYLDIKVSNEDFRKNIDATKYIVLDHMDWFMDYCHKKEDGFYLRNISRIVNMWGDTGSHILISSDIPMENLCELGFNLKNSFSIKKVYLDAPSEYKDKGALLKMLFQREIKQRIKMNSIDSINPNMFNNDEIEEILRKDYESIRDMQLDVVKRIVNRY